MSSSHGIYCIQLDGRKLYRLESRDSFELTLADVSSDDGIEVYPHVEATGLLFLQFRKRRVVVSAGPFVGLIPLTPKITVLVIPRLPVYNLDRILDVASRSLSAIPSVDRTYLAGRLASGSVLEFLVVNLNHAIQSVQSQGLHKNYVTKSALRSTPKGRIGLSGTQRAWAKGQYHLVQTSYFEQSSDTAPNRLLKEALRIALLQLTGVNDSRRRLIRAANLTLGSFPASLSRYTDDDRQSVVAILTERRLPDQKEYYYHAIKIALFIIDGNGVSLDKVGNAISLNSYIVNFETLFEDYMRGILSSGMPTGVLVQDGNHEGGRSLFDKKNGQRAQPDIILKDDERRTVVAEVKYKNKPNRDDINQVITYAVCYRTNKAVLVHQAKGASKGLYRIGTINGIDLDGYAFDLSGQSVKEEEAVFISALEKLLLTATPA